MLIIIIVILSTLCALFATGTISFKNSEVDNNLQDNMINNSQDNNEHREYTEEGIRLCCRINENV